MAYARLEIIRQWCEVSFVHDDHRTDDEEPKDVDQNLDRAYHLLKCNHTLVMDLLFLYAVLVSLAIQGDFHRPNEDHE